VAGNPDGHSVSSFLEDHGSCRLDRMKTEG
jgi:hypothetical protein